MAFEGGKWRWGSLVSLFGLGLVVAAAGCDGESAGDSSGGITRGDGVHAGGEGGAAGAAGQATSEGGEPNSGAPAGGSPAVAECVQRPLLGAYRLKAHNEVTSCDQATSKCAATPHLVEDKTVTFEIYDEREAPDTLTGDFAGPGISLGDGVGPTERWLDYFMVYYPAPGDATDITDTNLPQEKLGFWDPKRASGSWVRLLMDDCFGDKGVGPGFIHIDIELATGRVLDFARSCDSVTSTSWDKYRLRGTGELACDLATCNQLKNAAPKATIASEVAMGSLGGGQVVSGTYYLTDIKYDLGTGCDYKVPTEVRETLQITATSTTAGTAQFVTERPPVAAFTGSFDYSTLDNGITFQHHCGPESFQMLGSGEYVASATELRFRQPVPSCMGVATYVYAKQ